MSKVVSLATTREIPEKYFHKGRLYGNPRIDGFCLSRLTKKDRVWIKDQTNKKLNGIYHFYKKTNSDGLYFSYRKSKAFKDYKIIVVKFGIQNALSMFSNTNKVIMKIGQRKETESVSEESEETMIEISSESEIEKSEEIEKIGGPPSPSGTMPSSHYGNFKEFLLNSENKFSNIVIEISMDSVLKKLQDIKKLSEKQSAMRATVKELSSRVNSSLQQKLLLKSENEKSEQDRIHKKELEDYKRTLLEALNDLEEEKLKNLLSLELQENEHSAFLNDEKKE